MTKANPTFEELVNQITNSPKPDYSEMFNLSRKNVTTTLELASQFLKGINNRINLDIPESRVIRIILSLSIPKDDKDTIYPEKISFNLITSSDSLTNKMLMPILLIPTAVYANGYPGYIKTHFQALNKVFPLIFKSRNDLEKKYTEFLDEYVDILTLSFARPPEEYFLPDQLLTDIKNITESIHKYNSTIETYTIKSTEKLEGLIDLFPKIQSLSKDLKDFLTKHNAYKRVSKPLTETLSKLDNDLKIAIDKYINTIPCTQPGAQLMIDFFNKRPLVFEEDNDFSLTAAILLAGVYGNLVNMFSLKEYVPKLKDCLQQFSFSNHKLVNERLTPFLEANRQIEDPNSNIGKVLFDFVKAIYRLRYLVLNLTADGIVLMNGLAGIDQLYIEPINDFNQYFNIYQTLESFWGNYYVKFVSQFPNKDSLKNAKEDAKKPLYTPLLNIKIWNDTDKLEDIIKSYIEALEKEEEEE